MKARQPLQLAIANWDYSWLLRTSGRDEDEYHLLPRVMHELAERGFNALRVDAWPHLVAPDREGKRADEFVILPHRQRDLERGSREARHVRPHDRLLRLAQAAKAEGISLWLTSWLLPDTLARRSQVRNPDDFVRIWHATLDWLREQDALSQVVALDFAHHFPDQPAGYGAWQPLFGRTPLLAGRGWRAFNTDAIRRIDAFLVEVTQRLRTLYPQLHFGLSLASERAGQVKELDMSELDFLDLHLLPAARRWPLAASGGQRLLDEHQGYCRMHQLQPALTAGCGQLPADSQHLPDICRLSEQGVELALAAGVTVVNPSYYARPQSRLWQEVAWLQQVNRQILAARRTGHAFAG